MRGKGGRRFRSFRSAWDTCIGHAWVDQVSTWWPRVVRVSHLLDIPPVASLLELCFPLPQAHDFSRNLPMMGWDWMFQVQPNMSAHSKLKSKCKTRAKSLLVRSAAQFTRRAAQR